MVNVAQEVKEIVFEVGATVARVVVDATGAIIDKSRDIVGATIDLASRSATAVIDTGTELVTSISDKFKSLLRLKETSPVMIAREVAIPDRTELFSFDFDFLNVGDGDWLTLHFNEVLLWSFLGEDFIGESMKATASMPELAGKDGTFYFTLHSVGESNADVLVGNFAFKGAARSPSTSVPEPSPLLMLFFPLMYLLFYSQARKR